MEPTPKREFAAEDSLTVSANEAASAASLGIPPLPHTRHELFKIAHEVLDSEKVKYDSQQGITNAQSLNEVGRNSDLPYDIIGKYTNVAIRMISINGMHEFSFPLPVRKVIDVASGEFYKFKDFNSRIADIADAKLVSRSYKAIFICPETHYGSKLKVHIVMGNKDTEHVEEFLLNEENYTHLLVSSYALYG